MRHPFNTHDRLQRDQEPTLLLHSPDDDVIPISHAERNLTAVLHRDGAAAWQARLVHPQGNRNEAFALSERRIETAMALFLDAIFGTTNAITACHLWQRP